MPRMADEGQLGFDEEIIENPDVEAALVARQDRKAALSSVQREYKDAHDAAVGLLKAIELPEDKAVRIGRFRITRSLISAKHVEFDSKESTRLRITHLAGQATLDEEADLRPTGEINPEALRGAVERSSEPTPIRRPKSGGSQPSTPVN